jgi:phage terminase large subunit
MADRSSKSSSSSSSEPTTKLRIPRAFSGLFKPARYKAFYGGRGSGKSHSVASALVLRGAQAPIRWGCYREIQKSIRDSSKRLLDDKIAEHGLGWFYESTDAEIRGRNGTLFLFAGLRSNPDSVKSTEGLDGAWVEEAATVSKASIEILVPTVRKPGSELWFTWNPRHEKDPVNAMFRGAGGPPPNSIVRGVNFDENPWFPDVLREDMEWDRRRDPDKYAHIWLGGYQRNSQARVFRNWRVGSRDEFTADPTRTYRFGADWGFSVDPTVLVRCYIDGRTLYIDREAYKVGCEIDKIPALFDTVGGSRNWTIRADSARPETISYMRRQGFKIVPAIKGAGSVEDGVEFLKSYDIVVHPDCTHTIDELTLYSYKTDPLTDEVLPVLEDKHNHCLDAGRYALEDERRGSAVTRVRRF